MGVIRGILLGAVAMATIGCGSGGGEDGETAAFERIDVAAEPLRSAFDADAGDVRAIFLVSPT